MRLVLGFLALGIAFNCVAKAEMSAEDIKNRLIGSEIAWWELHGQQSGGLMLLPDGTAHISVGQPETATDNGRWSIEGNQLCTEWSALRDSRKCYLVLPASADVYTTSGGHAFKIVFAGV